MVMKMANRNERFESQTLGNLKVDQQPMSWCLSHGSVVGFSEGQGRHQELAGRRSIWAAD